jgi:glutathione synthase/RimK-type ligase-like ATP-grasp enzyme
MIVLWGLPGDEPLEAVLAAMRKRGSNFVLLDQRRVLHQRVELELGAELHGSVWDGGQCIELAAVSALYARVYDVTQIRHVAQADEETVARVREQESALWTWANETPARVVNRPSAMASNSSKPYQAALIEAQGFRVPQTLITTDVEAARQFWDCHGDVIYKSVSGVRSIVSRLGPGDCDRLGDVVWCPTQFQAYVPGRDHRVHVIGDEVFPVEVCSQAVDYRYAKRQGLSVDLRACSLPPEIAERARKTAAVLGLAVAGLDLRVTPDGEWYCFEVNPSPCFTYYEHHTGQPLADAVVSLLEGAHQ